MEVQAINISVRQMTMKWVRQTEISSSMLHTHTHDLKKRKEKRRKNTSKNKLLGPASWYGKPSIPCAVLHPVKAPGPLLAALLSIQLVAYGLGKPRRMAQVLGPCPSEKHSTGSWFPIQLSYNHWDHLGSEPALLLSVTLFQIKQIFLKRKHSQHPKLRLNSITT